MASPEKDVPPIGGRNRQRRRGEHMLAKAGITDWPPNLDPAALVAAIEDAALHASGEAATTEPPPRADATALEAVARHAGGLARALEALRKPERFFANSFLATELTVEDATRRRLIEQRRAQPREQRSDKNKEILRNLLELPPLAGRVLRSELQALKRAADRASKRALKAVEDGPVLHPAGDGGTADNRLITEALPAIYEEHFGRECGIGHSHLSDDTHPPTEGLRFIVGALCLLGRKESPSAVEQRFKRMRREAKAART